MMARSKSTFVCARCGVTVHLWEKTEGKPYWQHMNSWRGKPSCGQKPVVVERAAYEAAQNASRRGEAR